MQDLLEAPPLCREDALWSGLDFTVADEETFAREQQAAGDSVHFHRGVWWRGLRYGFCQPCFPLRLIDHRDAWPHGLRAPLGFMHLARPGSPANAVYRSIAREQVHAYSLQQVDKKRRNLVRSALSRLEVRPVQSLAELAAEGYQVYRSWRERTGWGRSKARPQVFSSWITSAFRRPRRFVLGAYLEDKLVAFMLPCAAHNVAFVSFVASHSSALWAHPNDALYHAFLCIARQTPGITTADMGPASSKPSLDKFKLDYGAIRQSPCYVWMNPAVRLLVGSHIKQRYPWLQLSAAC